MLFPARMWLLAEGESGVATDGPTGDPHSGYTSIYSGNRVALHWQNADSSAYTRIYLYNGATYDLWATVTPGITYRETAKFVENSPFIWRLYHYKNGQESAGYEQINYPEA